MREEHRKLSLEAPGAGSIPRGICATGGEDMTDYLPEIYQHFERRYPAVKEAFDALGAAEHEAGPLADSRRRGVGGWRAFARPQAAGRRSLGGGDLTHYRPRFNHHRLPRHQRGFELGRGGSGRRSQRKVARQLRGPSAITEHSGQNTNS